MLNSVSLTKFHFNLHTNYSFVYSTQRLTINSFEQIHAWSDICDPSIISPPPLHVDVRCIQQAKSFKLFQKNFKIQIFTAISGFSIQTSLVLVQWFFIQPMIFRKIVSNFQLFQHTFAAWIWSINSYLPYHTTTNRNLSRGYIQYFMWAVDKTMKEMYFTTVGMPRHKCMCKQAENKMTMVIVIAI